MAITWKEPCDQAFVESRPATAPCSRAAEPWVLVATILGSSMVFIDGTVVNVALPVLQRELGATVVEAQWVFGSYALFLAALLLVGGALGDHYGRRAMFGLGIAVFTVASIGCGLAWDPTSLIAARALQGVGAALLTPGSLAIISASFEEARRGRAIGTWSSLTAISTALGPVLGGWLIENVSWRWIFLLNIPIALLVLVVLFWQVPESRDEAGAPLDPWGALLATIGLGGLVYGLIESPNLGLADPLVFFALAGGILALALFFVIEARIRSPMVPLRLFRLRELNGVNLLTLLLYASLSAALFFLPFNLIQVQGYSATAAGAAFLPFMVVMFALSRWAGGLADRYGARQLLLVGPLLAGAACALYAAPGIGGSYWTTFFPAVALHGLGMALTVTPLTTMVLGSVPASQAGLASGMNNAISRVAGLLGIALIGVIVLGVFSAELNRRVEPLDLPPAAVESLMAERVNLAEAQLPATLSPDQEERVRAVIAESFVTGFRAAALVAAALAVAGGAAAWGLIGSERSPSRPSWRVWR